MSFSSIKCNMYGRKLIDCKIFTNRFTLNGAYFLNHIEKMKFKTSVIVLLLVIHKGKTMIK